MKGLTPKTRARERAARRHQDKELARLVVFGPRPTPEQALAELAEADEHLRALLAERRGRDPILDPPDEGEAAGAATPTASEISNGDQGYSTDDTTIPDLSQVQAVRPVWGTGHQTQLDLEDGQHIMVGVPHSKIEQQVQAMGWTEPCSGSGYWMNPAKMEV